MSSNKIALHALVMNLLRSAVGKTHVLWSGFVMDYTTSQKSTMSTLALELSVSSPFYPWVTATEPTLCRDPNLPTPKGNIYEFWPIFE